MFLCIQTLVFAAATVADATIVAANTNSTYNFEKNNTNYSKFSIFVDSKIVILSNQAL